MTPAKNIKRTEPSMESTKTAPKSFTFTPSEAVAKQLEEFSKIAMVNPSEIINWLINEQLAPRPEIKGDFPHPLGNFIWSRNYTKAQAIKVANNCNALLTTESERTGRPLTEETAVVERYGRVAYIRFPLFSRFRDKDACNALLD
jgi:hypothetical protein